MNAYLDTSVVVALILQETAAEHLADWFVAHAATLHFSDFGRGEVLSALALQVRRGALSGTEADLAIAAVDQWLEHCHVEPITSPDIMAASRAVAHYASGLRLPDAIHVAVAARLGCCLVSLDHQQRAGATMIGVVSLDPLNITRPEIDRS